MGNCLATITDNLPGPAPISSTDDGDMFFTSSIVKVENKNFEKAGIKATCKLGSSREIPFDRKFDLIFTTLSFHHWENRDSSISYILSKLSDRGTFLIIEFMEDNYKSPVSLHKKHSISKKYAESLHFDGYERKINTSGEFIALSFTKISP